MPTGSWISATGTSLLPGEICGSPRLWLFLTMNTLEMSWGPNHHLLQIVLTWMDEGFLWMFLDTTPALRGIFPLYKSFGWEMVSKDLDASLNLPLKCEALYLHLKGRRGLRMAPWQAPRKWLEAGPNANPKEFHGILTLGASSFCNFLDLCVVSGSC